MSAAMHLEPEGETVVAWVRCTACRTVDSVEVDASDPERPRAYLPICLHCDAQDATLVALDYEPDIHVPCDGEGCTACSWTGWDPHPVPPPCTACERPARWRPARGLTLCDRCDGRYELERIGAIPVRWT